MNILTRCLRITKTKIVLIAAVFILFGCGETDTSSVNQKEELEISNAGAADWELPDGSYFSAWTSDLNTDKDPTYIWCDIENKKVSYQINGEGAWKLMQPEAIDDEGEVFHILGGSELLPAGKHTIDLKVEHQGQELAFKGLQVEVEGS